MTTVDQTVSDDWRNRELDASFEGSPARLTEDEWEREYSDFCDTEMFGGANEAVEQVFRGLR